MKPLIVLVARFALLFVACAVGLETTSKAQKKPPVSLDTNFAAEPPAGRWEELCPAMDASGHDRDGNDSQFRKKRTLVIKRDVSPKVAFSDVDKLKEMHKRSFMIGSQDGSVIGVSTNDGASIMRCVEGKLTWRQSLKLAPTSVTTDAAGNVYYAGVAGGSQGAQIVLGKLTPKGAKAWEARIDGPGNQSEPTLGFALDAPGALYVLGTSTRTLPGQPASATGNRFVARYSASGKQEWLRQSSDFGRPTTEITVRERPDGLNFVILGDDTTPAEFDVDAAGNVYIATMLAGAVGSKGGKRTVPLARLTKINAQGDKVSTATVKVAFENAPPDLLLTKVLARRDGQSIYLVLGRVVVKLDGHGKQRWARTFFTAGIKPQFEGEYVAHVHMTAFSDAVLRENMLYLLSFYSYDDNEGVLLNETLVAAIDAERGKPKWARVYGGQDGETKIQALPSGALLVMRMDFNPFASPLTRAKLYELSDAKADPEKPTAKQSGPPEASLAAGPTAAVSALPVVLPSPEKVPNGQLEQMSPSMPVFGWDRDVDLAERSSQVLTPGVSPTEAFNSADALKRMQGQALMLGSAGGAVVGISIHDGVLLRRDIGTNYAWSKVLKVAPTSLATDLEGNIYYAGVGAGSKGAYVEIGKFTAKGADAWKARIDGPGHQSEAQIRVAKDGKSVYVLGLSTSALPGQPAAAAGHRFVARYGPSGKQTWLRQAVDFGMPTTTIAVSKNHEGQQLATMSEDLTPSSIDIDAAGNVCVAAGLVSDATPDGKSTATGIARVVKLDAKGQPAWKTTAQVATDDTSRRTLARVLASQDGRTIFVVAGYFIVKLDGSGKQQWARVLDPTVERKAIPRLDAALQGGKLYYFYHSWNVVAVVDAELGKLQSVRAYYDANGTAARPTIQALPGGAIMLSTAHDTYTADIEAASATSLWRLTDMKAPPLK